MHGEIKSAEKSKGYENQAVDEERAFFFISFLLLGKSRVLLTLWIMEAFLNIQDPCTTIKLAKLSTSLTEVLQSSSSKNGKLDVLDQCNKFGFLKTF